MSFAGGQIDMNVSRLDAPLRVALLHFGEASGVRSRLSPELRALGNRVVELQATGPLEPRGAGGSLRLSPTLAIGLAWSAVRFGRGALAHRWSTPFAFDVHSRQAGALLRGLRPTPDVVLQHGALFAPGARPTLPYVLLLDHTRRAAMQQPAAPELGLAAQADYGPAWYAREVATYLGASAIAVHSNRVKRSLTGDYGVPEGLVHVVGAGANIFPELAPREDHGRTLVFVGKEFERKGGRLLAAAFAALRPRWPGLRLLIAGPTRKLVLPEGAEQLGLVPFERLPALFARSTLFVMPTLLEPFGLAFLDAMACGLPCIGTEIEAVPEIVRHGETGLLVPPRDERALIGALEALLSDPERARRMGAAGRERVRLGFRWSLVAGRLDELLRQASGGGRRGSGR
ncbi:MAG: glycosyltransferase family 4 protein [Deltaproteobacteria bacterium]